LSFLACRVIQQVILCWVSSMPSHKLLELVFETFNSIFSTFLDMLIFPSYLSFVVKLLITINWLHSLIVIKNKFCVGSQSLTQSINQLVRKYRLLQYFVLKPNVRPTNSCFYYHHYRFIRCMDALNGNCIII